MTIGKLKRQKSPGTDQFPAEMIKAGGRTIRSETHELILFGIRRNCLWSGRGRTFHLSMRTAVIIGAYHFSQGFFFLVECVSS